MAASNEPSKEVLKIAVAEQRRFHDELTSAFRGVRSKILYLIAVTFTLLTFLYAGAATNPHDHTSIRERLFIPDELYGIIFYIIGLTFILYSLGRLIHGARPGTTWSVPFELAQYEDLKQTDERAYLQALKDEYVTITRANLRRHEEKNLAIRDAFYPLLAGAIILVILRYFQ